MPVRGKTPNASFCMKFSCSRDTQAPSHQILQPVECRDSCLHFRSKEMSPRKVDGPGPWESWSWSLSALPSSPCLWLTHHSTIRCWKRGPHQHKPLPRDWLPASRAPQLCTELCVRTFTSSYAIKCWLLLAFSAPVPHSHSTFSWKRLKIQEIFYPGNTEAINRGIKSNPALFLVCLFVWCRT